MVTIYDPTTGAPIEVDDLQKKAALLSGQAVLLKDKTYNILDSEGKWIGSVPGSLVPQYLAQGNQLSDPARDEIIKKVYAHPILFGPAGVAADKMVNSFLLGVPEAAEKAVSKPEVQQEFEREYKEHPGAAALGTAGGFGAQLALGGPLFRGIGALGSAAEGATLRGLGALGAETAPEAIGLGTKMLGSAARYGAETAALTAPQAITEAALGDPKEAAEHLLYGLGAGVALGVTAPLLKGAAKIVGSALGKPIGLDFTAENPLQKMTTDQTIKSLIYGTSKADRQAITSLGERLTGKAESGEKEISNFLHSNSLNRNIGEDFDAYFNRLNQQKELIGNQIGDLYAQLDKTGAEAITTDELISKIRKEVVDPLRREPTKAPQVKALNQYLKELKESSLYINGERGFVGNPELGVEIPEPPLKLNDIWQHRKGLDAQIYAEKKASLGNPSPLNEEYLKIRTILDQEVKEKGEAAMKEVGKQFLQPLSKLNKEYQILSTVSDVAENSMLSEQSRRNFSLSDYLSGGFGGVSAVAAFHHPLSAATGLISGVANKFLRENGNSLIAKYGNQLSLYFADKAKQEAEQQFSKIPHILKSFANNSSKMPVVLASKTGDALQDLTGDKYKDDQEAFQALSDNLSNLMANPQSKRIQEIAQMLSKGAPGIAQNYLNQQKQAMTFLYNEMPKDPNPPGTPFQQPWQPTKSQLKAFKDKASIVANPWSIVDRLQDGTINQNHIKALRTVYPSTNNKIKNSIKQYGLDNPKMPYNKKLQLSLLIGEPLDSSLKRVQQLQASYQPQAPKPMANGKLEELPGSQPTTMQRVSNDLSNA